MGKLTRHLGEGVRPQFVVLLAVGLVSLWGWTTVVGAWFASRPATVVARSPLAPQVLSAATRLPVDCAKLRCLALTFDDGPHSAVTPQILDTLSKHNARATFFVLGSHVTGNEALLRREFAEGHEIGNHSWSHVHFTRISLEQVVVEVTNTQTAIMRAGVPAPHLFRPPYGDISPAVATHIPLAIIRWNIDPEDWHPKHRARLLEHMAAQANPGGIVVLHDTEPTTAAMLDQLVTQLQTGGYTLVTVSELLSLPPGQPGTFFGR